MTKVTLRHMLEAGVHFGHKARFWDPKMQPYIYGTRSKIHIIDLDKTLPMFNKAMDYIAEVASRNGKILFVGTKFSARKIVREQAIRCGMPYIDYRWLGGMLTNYKTIRKSIKRLKELEAFLLQRKALARLTKKEVLNLQREKDKLEMTLGGIKDMGGLPDAIFVIDVSQEKIAIAEANNMRLPVIGVIDTNGSPDGIDYPIPGNDDAGRAITLYMETAANLIMKARSKSAQATETTTEKASATTEAQVEDTNVADSQD